MLSTLFLIGYIGLAGADLGQTMHCVGAGTCTEANPILAPLADYPAWYGTTKALMTTGVIAAVQHYTKKGSKKRLWSYIGLAVAQGVVVALNAHRLHQGEHL